jgi:BolA protein
MSHPSHPTTLLLETRMREGLSPNALEILDESHLHAGHAGAAGGGRHYRVRMSCQRFVGLTPVARHRLVYDLISDLMPHPIHALALELSAPSPATLAPIQP